jgi:tryptophan synthase alpha chain
VSRIASRFRELQRHRRKALIPYITAGDPSPDSTVPLMHAMVEAGADIIELGVPFSDPMADGPVIQAACERALTHGTSLRRVLGLVTTFRQRDPATPIVLMGYLNPVEVMGYAKFARMASEAGIDGLLTVDLPPEEAHELTAQLKDFKIDPIFLLAPTSDAVRLKVICDEASGFVYYVSLKGVTGANTLDIDSVREKLDEIRRYAKTPIGVGFGIKDADSAANVAQIADAVVVGSAIVKLIETYQLRSAQMIGKVAALLEVMRKAMDKVTTDEQVA